MALSSLTAMEALYTVTWGAVVGTVVLALVHCLLRPLLRRPEVGDVAPTLSVHVFLFVVYL
jgi:hypothetical protein